MEKVLDKTETNSDFFRPKASFRWFLCTARLRARHLSIACRMRTSLQKQTGALRIGSRCTRTHSHRQIHPLNWRVVRGISAKSVRQMLVRLGFGHTVCSVASSIRGDVMSFQVSVGARRGNPQAVWWGLDQISRIRSKRDFVGDYANTALLTFASTAPNEHYAGGDRFGNVMLAGTLPDFVADNVDTDYPRRVK